MVAITTCAALGSAVAAKLNARRNNRVRYVFCMDFLSNLSFVSCSLARASATPRRTLPGNIRWSAVPWLERRTSDAVPPGVKDDEGGAKYHGIERKGFLTPAGPRP